MFYELTRRVLFKLGPETAHHIALEFLKDLHRVGLARLLGGHVPEYPREVMGLTFPNPVGLAAGMDKDGDYVDALGDLGFGFLELGTITPRAQPGNPKPRLFRLPMAQALINRMGFNNKGVDYLVERLKGSKFRGIIGINIGKNLDTPVERAIEDYLICLRKVYPYAGYIAINISSPNTPGLRSLQHGEALDRLTAGLKAEQARLAHTYGKYVPLAVKIAPDLSPAEISAIADHVRRSTIDGVIVANTTLSREGVEGLPHADETGGLSGRPLLTPSNRVLKQFHAALGNEVPLIGVGGIMSAADAMAKIEAGATLLQIYTGFVYRGSALIGEIVSAFKP
jgi:dihydroorotate dehydrogenase